MSLLLSLAVLWIVPAPAQLAAPSAVAWFEGSLDSALERARGETRPLLVCLRGGDGPGADALERALASPAGADALAPALCVTLRRDDARCAELLRHAQLGAETSVLRLDGAGECVDACGAPSSPDAAVLELQRMRTGRDTLAALEERWHAAKPDSAAGLELASSLLERLEALGAGARAKELREHLRAEDPKGTTRAGARLVLDGAVQRLRAAAASTDMMSMEMADLTPIQGLAKKSRFPDVRSAACEWLGEQKRAEGERGAALEYAQAAWDAAPDELRETLGPRLLESALADAAALEAGQKRQLLALAQAVLDSAEKATRDEAAWRARHPVSSGAGFQAARQRWLAKVLLLNGKEKQAAAALARASELEGTPAAR